MFPSFYITDYFGQFPIQLNLLVWRIFFTHQKKTHVGENPLVHLEQKHLSLTAAIFIYALCLFLSSEIFIHFVETPMCTIQKGGGGVYDVFVNIAKAFSLTPRRSLPWNNPPQTSLIRGNAQHVLNLYCGRHIMALWLFNDLQSCGSNL